MILALAMAGCSDQVGCIPTGQIGKVEQVIAVRPFVKQWVEAERHDCSDGSVQWIER